MKFIDGNFIYTVELSGGDIYRLTEVLNYAVRSKNKAVKNYAQDFLKDLAGRGEEKEVDFGKCT